MAKKIYSEANLEKYRKIGEVLRDTFVASGKKEFNFGAFVSEYKVASCLHTMLVRHRVIVKVKGKRNMYDLDLGNPTKLLSMANNPEEILDLINDYDSVLTMEREAKVMEIQREREKANTVHGPSNEVVEEEERIAVAQEENVDPAHTDFILKELAEYIRKAATDMANEKADKIISTTLNELQDIEGTKHLYRDPNVRLKLIRDIMDGCLKKVTHLYVYGIKALIEKKENAHE